MLCPLQSSCRTPFNPVSVPLQSSCRLCSHNNHSTSISNPSQCWNLYLKLHWCLYQRKQLLKATPRLGVEMYRFYKWSHHSWLVSFLYFVTWCPFKCFNNCLGAHFKAAQLQWWIVNFCLVLTTSYFAHIDPSVLFKSVLVEEHIINPRPTKW